MPAKVILTCTHGKLKGAQYTFDGRNSSIVGKSKECYPRLPDDEHHREIGRRHCLLDVNPPEVRIRDLGSLNGTYVNGKNIGQRRPDQSAEEGARLRFPEYELKQGDEISLGTLTFRVEVVPPTHCDWCEREIPEAEKASALVANGVHWCEECRQAEAAHRVQAAPRPPKTCAKCKKDVSLEIGNRQPSDYICSVCRAKPLQLVKLLLNLADEGDESLVAIQGYDLLEELGRGGMGAVYLARHIKTGKQVALKVMLPEVAANEYARESFLREVENTRALRHSNVVELRDWGFSMGTFFFTLEYCEGRSVELLRLERGGRLPLREAIPIILQTLEGLDYAHHAEIPYVKMADGTVSRGRGLVHRDIKPANLFLANAGNLRVAKVGDYGLAKAFDLAGLAGLTRTGTKGGSPWFMPRQQVENFKYVQPEVDVWAAAATFYLLVTGASPRDFPKGEDPWRIACEKRPIPIMQRGVAIPPRLAEVIDYALIDEPEIGFKTAVALKRAILQAL